MIYLIIATACFSLSFGLIKDQLALLPAEFVAFGRLFIAFIMFAPFLRGFKKVHLKALLIGVIQFGMMYLFFIKAFKYLQGNEIAILTTTTPIFAGIFSVILGEKFKWIYIVCIILSVIGAGVIVWDNVTFDMLIKGIILMELSNCCFALGQVLWKKYIGEMKSDIMSCAYLGAFLFVLPFMVVNVDFTAISMNLKQTLALLYLAIVPTGVGFWLWNKGTSKVGYSMLAVMNNLKIPLGVLFSIVIFGERVDVVNFIIGSIIILTAITVLYFVQQGKSEIKKFFRIG